MKMTFDQWCVKEGYDRSALTDKMVEHLTPAWREAADDSDDRAAQIFRAAQQYAAKHSHDQPKVDNFMRIADEAVNQAWTTQRAEMALLREDRSIAPMILTPKAAAGSHADHLAAAILVKSGNERLAEKKFGERIMEQSKGLHRQSMLDLFKHALVGEFRDVPSDRYGLMQAASTGSMPTALGSAADKVLEASYTQAPSAWRSFAAVRSVSDFRTHVSVRPSFSATLKQLPPDAEIEHGSYQEETFEFSASTYARRLEIDRVQIVNDDLSAFAEVIPALAKAGARSLSNLVVETILANAGSFWSSGNSNYQSGAGTVLSSNSLTDAIELLRKMKDGEGNLLDLQPRVLLVPPDLETAARELLRSNEVSRDVFARRMEGDEIGNGDRLPTDNVHQGIAELAVEPRLSDSDFTGNSATGWYLFSDPSNAAVIVAFLGGMDRPTIQSFGLDADPSRLSFSTRVYWDFGAALGDPRASVFSDGTD